MNFTLHPQLEADTDLIGDFPLCRVLLHREAIGPWLIIVPRVDNITEVHHLSVANQAQLIKESALVAELLEQEFHPKKLNVGSIGNLVPQLHWHVIARFEDDICWPNPIWGNTNNVVRNKNNQTALIEELNNLFIQLDDFQISS